MKPLTSLALIIALLLLTLPLLSGCWRTNRRVTQSELPANWHTSLEQRAQHSVDIEGIYRDTGERFEKTWMAAKSEQGRFVFPRTSSISYLAELAGYPYSPTSRPTLTVEFTVEGPKRLRAVAREGSKVASERLWDAEWNTTVRAWILDSRSDSLGMSRSSSRLFKGRDGRLYLQRMVDEAGLLVVFPTSDHEESWTRWEPVP